MSVEVHPGGCPHRSGESDGGFLIGIGIALVKQLVGVDIGFTPASHFQARRNKYG